MATLLLGLHPAKRIIEKGKYTSSTSPGSRDRDGDRSLSFPTQKGGPTVKLPCLGRSPPRHGNFTVGPPFCVGKDRLRSPSRSRDPGLALEVYLPFSIIYLAEWRPNSKVAMSRRAS